MKKDFEKNRDLTIQQFLQGKEGDQYTVKTNNHLDDSYLNDFRPLEVKCFGNFERAFKAFRAVVQKDRILSEYRQRQSYEKPSEKKRRKQNEMRQKEMELAAKQEKILSGEFEKELIKKQ